MEFRTIEGAEKEQLEKTLRDLASGGEIAETENSTALTLTKDDFVRKMLQEKDGNELLSLLQSGEKDVVERMGLCHGYRKDGQAFFDVPGWNNLVAHLRIVNSV